MLASDRISRTVKYASSCPSLRAAPFGTLWRVFPRFRSATLGLTPYQSQETDPDRRADSFDKAVLFSYAKFVLTSQCTPLWLLALWYAEDIPHTEDASSHHE